MARTTDKRERILEYITQFTRENGYSPSVREICEGVGLASTATVHYHLNALRQEGSINMDGKKNRTISLPDRLPIGKIPVVGVVTAGVPILAVENARRRPQKTGRSSWRCWTTLPPSSAFTAKRARSGFCRRTLRMSPSTAPIAQFWVLSKPSSANTEY